MQQHTLPASLTEVTPSDQQYYVSVVSSGSLQQADMVKAWQEVLSPAPDLTIRYPAPRERIILEMSGTSNQMSSQPETPTGLIWHSR